MSPFERMLYAKGGSFAKMAQMLYQTRTRKRPAPPTPANIRRRDRSHAVTLHKGGHAVSISPSGEVTYEKAEEEKQVQKPVSETSIYDRQKNGNMPRGNIPSDIPRGVVSSLSEEIKRNNLLDTSGVKTKKYIPPQNAGYTYSTGTPEQLSGKTGGYTGIKPDTGFYAPNVVEKRKHEMALKKGYYVGKDDE